MGSWFSHWIKRQQMFNPDEVEHWHYSIHSPKGKPLKWLIQFFNCSHYDRGWNPKSLGWNLGLEYTTHLNSSPTFGWDTERITFLSSFCSTPMGSWMFTSHQIATDVWPRWGQNAEHPPKNTGWKCGSDNTTVVFIFTLQLALLF